MILGSSIVIFNSSPPKQAPQLFYNNIFTAAFLIRPSMLQAQLTAVK
jgi:hypothetical protein